MTVLHSRTLPLVRYQLGDRVAIGDEPCGCGLPFRRLALIEGRQDDLLDLPAPDGRLVSIHPTSLHGVLDRPELTGWQVRQVAPRAVDVLVAAPTGAADEPVLARDVTRLLDQLTGGRVAVTRQ